MLHAGVVDPQAGWHPGPLPGHGCLGNCTQTLINNGTCRGIRIKALLTLPGTFAERDAGVEWVELNVFVFIPDLIFEC